MKVKIGDDKISFGSDLWCIVFAVIAGIMGCAEYGTIGIAVGIGVYFMLFLCSFIGWMPFGGWALYYFVGGIAVDRVLNIAHVVPGITTMVLFISFFIVSIIFTVIGTIAILIAVVD